jgi:hypothetical protein
MGINSAASEGAKAPASAEAAKSDTPPIKIFLRGSTFGERLTKSLIAFGNESSYALYDLI